MNENKGKGCFGSFFTIIGWIILAIITFVLLASAIGSCNSPKSRNNYSSTSSYSSSYTSGAQTTTPKPIQTPQPVSPTSNFADDAEDVVKIVKEGFSKSDVKISWFINGSTLSMTLKINSLSGDDLRDMYLDDPAAQDTIDALSDSVKSANKSCYDTLKSKGYQEFSIIFTMVTNDNLEIVTAENGKITYCISARNFRYG